MPKQEFVRERVRRKVIRSIVAAIAMQMFSVAANAQEERSGTLLGAPPGFENQRIEKIRKARERQHEILQEQYGDDFSGGLTGNRLVWGLSMRGGVPTTLQSVKIGKPNEVDQIPEIREFYGWGDSEGLRFIERRKEVMHFEQTINGVAVWPASARIEIDPVTREIVDIVGSVLINIGHFPPRDKALMNKSQAIKTAREANLDTGLIKRRWRHFERSDVHHKAEPIYSVTDEKIELAWRVTLRYLEKPEHMPLDQERFIVFPDGRVRTLDVQIRHDDNK